MRRWTALVALLVLLAGAPLTQSVAAPPLPPAIVAGTIASVGPDMLEVTTPAGRKQIQMTPTTRVEVWLPARPADLKVGVLIGVESHREPNGSLRAVVIHLFAPERRGQVPARQFPWVNGNIMTNAVISSTVGGVSGETLTLPYQGGTATVIVTPATDIRRAVAGARGDLKIGRHILAFEQANENGTLTASGVALDKGP